MKVQIGLIRLFMLAIVITLSLTVVAQARLYDTTYASTNVYRYGPNARMPAFSAWEQRPSGYGLTRQTTPYGGLQRVENHFFVGHTSNWDRTPLARASLSPGYRTLPINRPTSNAVVIPQRQWTPQPRNVGWRQYSWWNAR